MASLRGYIDDAVTTLEIDDTTSFPTNGGVVLIEAELIRYTYATDKAILGCERAYNGTTAVAHDDKTLVEVQDTTVPLYGLQEYNDHGTPTDHFTGVGFALKGSRYTDLDTATIYLNTSDENDPIWVAVGTGSGGSSAGPAGSVQLGDGAGGFVATPDLTFDDGDSSLHTNSIRMANGATLFLDEGNVQIDTTNLSTQLGLVINENAVQTVAITKNTGGGSLEINNDDGSVLLEVSGETKASFTDTTITLSADSDPGFQVIGSGVTVFPGRADGYNEIQIRGDAGCYVDFYHNDLIEVSSRIISNIDFDLRLVTRDTMPVRVIVDEHSANKQWSFEVDGTLTLPADGILSQPSGRFLIIPGSDTGTMEVQGRNDGYGEIALKADGGYLGFKGNDGHYIGRFNWTDNSYLRLDTKQAIPLVLHIDADGADKTWTYAANGDLTNSNGLLWTQSDLSLNVAGGYFRGTGDTWLELFDVDTNNVIRAKPDNGEISIVHDGGTSSLRLFEGVNNVTLRTSGTDNNAVLECGTKGIELLPFTGKGVFISHTTGGADACASLHFETSGQGVILPRMDTTTRDAIASPSEGLIIYNYTTHVLNFYNGTTWAAV